MNEVRMPALTGGSPLGILAAIGVLRLLGDYTADPPKLRWEKRGLTAVLVSERPTIDEVVADLTEIVLSIAEGSVLPGLPGGFPPPGAAPDQLRVPQGEFRERRQMMLASMDSAEAREADRWLASLVTDLAADSQQGRVAISQFTAPSGKQSMATMLEKPLEQVRRRPELLAQALVGWRRVPGVTGEYLDHRAMWDAAEDGSGTTGSMRGVPGATWLALMSYPLMRTTGSIRKRPATSGWHELRDGRRPVDELRLPVWRQPLGPEAVVALIEHPALAPDSPRRVDEPAGERDPEVSRQRDREMLGVIHVCRARRWQPTGGKSAGVLRTLE